MRLVLLIVLFAAYFSETRSQSHGEEFDLASDSAVHAPSYRSVGDFMRSGTFRVHIRSFSMATVNKGELLDYSTSAFGGGLGYHSPEFKGFRFGVSGFFAFQLFENNIRIADPTTGNVNRYEILLYDMNDLENVNDLDRLEDLYIAYRHKGFQAKFGRQEVNTPLLNSQDNRMRQNLFSGLTLDYRQGFWHFTAGWYTHVTMRGTVDWYSIEESFGVYPFGRNPLGTPSAYKHNVRSEGIAIIGAHFKPSDKLKVDLWNYTAENVFNLSLAQIEHHWNVGKGDLGFGLQGLWQEAIHNGGHEELESAFMDPSTRGLALGSRLAYRQKRHEWSLNMLRVSDQGRIVFPREWGREQLFVTLPRERHEGNGDVWAFTAKYDAAIGSKGTRMLAGMGYVRNPSINDFKLNKYGVPSYYHFVGGVHQSFQGPLEGLELDLLVVQKTAAEPDNLEDIYRINRVDLWNFNVVMNYRF